MRQRASQAVNSRFPRLAWDIWGFRRSMSQASVGEILPSMRNQWHRRTSHQNGLNVAGSLKNRLPKLLIVVPTADHVEIPWKPAEGNYSFELFETARALMGDRNVETLLIYPSQNTEAYHRHIIDHLNDGGFTHVISRIDIESNGAAGWSWDEFVRRLRRDWQGIFLPLTYDSAYPYISMHLDRITRLHHLSMPIVLDRPIKGVIRPVRPAAGPLFLPLSDASTYAIDEALLGVEADLDLTFIGNVSGYPYRADLLDVLAAEGLKVCINPQGRSSSTMPGFTSYANALRRSKVTLNFTRCNGVPVTQLKTRLLEGSLFGAVVASDSALYADQYFDDGQEFFSYSSPADLKTKLTYLLEDESRLLSMRKRARVKADILRVRNFWDRTDAALRERLMPPLLLN